MNEIKAPEPFKNAKHACIFLAGSIEMGTAEPWQENFVQEFQDYDVTFLNPRRTDWDSSWVQEKSNPEFSEQVNWELDALNFADYVVFYFDKNTKSPITLMELGLYAHKKCIVCCPTGFYRKGNVDIVCARYKIPVVESFEELVKEVKSRWS